MWCRQGGPTAWGGREGLGIGQMRQKHRGDNVHHDCAVAVVLRRGTREDR
jgi:hypothetical protein